LLAAACSATASAVPNRLILDSVTDGVRRTAIIDLPQVGVSGRGVDVFGDCIALTMGLGDSNESRALDWLTSPTLGSCPGAIESIRRFDAAQGLSGGYEYFRYWHGYTVVSRPLIAAVGVTGLRIVLFWAIIGALAGFARRLWRFHGPVAPVALLGPFLLTTDTIELARSLPHGVPVLVAVGGAWAVHRAAAGRDPDGPAGAADAVQLVSVGFVAGAAYVYVDLLTTPPGAWALAICAGMLASSRYLDGVRLLARGALVGAAWIIGWGWMWASKWALAAVFLGADRVRRSVGDAVNDRLVGERDYIDLGLFNSIDENVAAWLGHPLTPVVILSIVVASTYRWRRPSHRVEWRNRGLLAVPAIVPLVWFELLRNHSLLHFRFTYRSLGVSAGIIAVALLVQLPPTSSRKRR
jgi:hypothetical protein